MTRLTILLLVFGATPAAAHIGHIGEHAGHAHWIGLGAAIAAAAVAAAVIKLRGKTDAPAEEEVEEETSEETPS